MNSAPAQKALRQLGRKEKARVYQGFFKTGPGDYGEGDIFIGVSVPDIRSVAKRFKGLPLTATQSLLCSPIHEERLLALFIMTLQFEKGDAKTRCVIFEAYLKNTRHINNWDLVDLSAYKIVGAYLRERDRFPLYRLASSPVLWEKRIGIVATFAYIRENEFTDTLQIAAILLSDSHDLIHKAVGWMLREVGKRDLAAEEDFLKKHYRNMPRTMLRYAIEKFPERKRLEYLKGSAV
jgi:3-methyladenine DNA glycosylase AlkD